MDEDNQEGEAQVEQPKPKKRRQLVDVKVVALKDESALVEWTEWVGAHPFPQRGYVPADAVENGKCDKDALDAAYPYGVPWARFLNLEHVTPKRIEAELHRRHIWWTADIDKDVRLAMGAVAAVAGPIIGSLHRQGRDYETFEMKEQ